MITRHNVTVEFDSEEFHLWDTLEKELRDFLESRGCEIGYIDHGEESVYAREKQETRDFLDAMEEHFDYGNY